MLDARLDASMTAAQLEQLERDLIALLYTIWRLRGKPKRIVTARREIADKTEKN